MSFGIAISGLETFARALDMTGNNIANSDTPGFKSQVLLFADRVAESISRSVSIGTGVLINGKDINFSQGGIESTSDPLNLAIQGDGFFRVSKNGNTFFSRSGIFSINLSETGVDNTISDPGGNLLTGYSIDPVTGKASSTLDILHIDQSDVKPKATDAAVLQCNLDADSSVPAQAFSATDPESYNYSNSMTVYDTLGSKHTFQVYYRITTKTAAKNTWTLYATLDGNDVTTTPAGVLGTISYDNNGQPIAPTPFAVTGAITTGGKTPFAFNLDLSDSTQFAIPSNTISNKQNGYAAGTLNSLFVDEKGLISGKYDNGNTVPLGQVALSTFSNRQGLKNMGNNLWEETASSGQANSNLPGVGSLGGIMPQAIEKSNVNITQQLVDLIIYQRAYQANVQTIKAADQIQQATVQIR